MAASMKNLLYNLVKEYNYPKISKTCKTRSKYKKRVNNFVSEFLLALK